MSASIPRTSKVNLLPPDIASLAHGLPPTAPDTLFVLGSHGGLSVAPDAGFPLTFGRNAPEVHVCVGADDTTVSRKQGIISRQYSRWMLHNTGQLPIRLPGSRLLLGGDQVELPLGYTPLFIVAPHQEHLLQVRIATHLREANSADAFDADTRGRTTWELTEVERLVVTCLSQRYLRNDPRPQPLTWDQVAQELTLLCREKWTWRRAAHEVADMREHLSSEVDGLRAEEVPPPVGNVLNHNLIMELLVSTTITKKDLELLDGQDER